MFKEFDLPKLFDISTTKSVDKNKLDFVADGEYDFIGRTSVNWGLQGKLHKLSFEPNPKDSFSLIQVGETVALWREREWYASQNLFLLNPKIDKIKENKLYFQGAINKEMSRYGKEYNSYPTMKSLAVTKIFLPVIENSNPDHEYTVNDIDWQYMQERIAELEQERIAELDAYLKVTRLDDYTLSDEDKKILLNATQHEFKKFKVKDVFDVSPVNRITEPNKSYIPDDEIIGQGGNTPYIAAISKNNGITGYSYREPNNMGDCVTLSTTAASPDTVFYQPDAFIGRQQMSAFRRKDGNPLGYGCGIYLATLVRKLTIGFNYGNKLTNDFLKNTTISLSVIESSNPNHEYTVDDIDWQYMERYIRAMEKVVIADVVKYKDRVIDETRKLVS